LMPLQETHNLSLEVLMPLHQTHNNLSLRVFMALKETHNLSFGVFVFCTKHVCHLGAFLLCNETHNFVKSRFSCFRF
jgi:hypothetical protein